MALSPKSKDSTKSESSLKIIIENLQKCQETRQIHSLELWDLEAMEKKLFEIRKCYKEMANERIVRIYATKILIFVVYLISFVLAIVYSVYHKHNQGPPESVIIILIVGMMVVSYGIIFVFMFVDFFKVTLLPDEEVPENWRKFIKSEGKVSSIMLMNQQNELIDIFFKEVEPMRRNADALENQRIKLRLISSIPFALVLFISMGIIFNRAITKWDPKELSMCTAPIMAGLFGFPFMFLPV